MSNVLCSRPDISGYGEAHIAYGDAGALGRLAVNQHRRGAWRPGARHLFDKVLHSRYDAAAHPGLFDAHGLFLVRTPGPSIESIRHLFSRIGSGEYPTDAAAAAYYEERLEQLARLWTRFPAARRIGTSYEELTADPEGFLGRVSTLLALDPPLSNTYSARPDAPAPGAGDPLSSHLFTSIVSGGRSSSLAPEARVLDLPDCGMSRLEALYARLCALFSGVD